MLACIELLEREMMSLSLIKVYKRAVCTLL